MALKITATLIVRKGDLDNQALAQDTNDAAAQVDNWLRMHLPANLPLESLTVTAVDVKRDGTPKKNQATLDTNAYNDDTSYEGTF